MTPSVPTYAGRWQRNATVLLVAMLAAVLASCGSDNHPSAATAYPLDDTLRLNQIQVLGTHNSYHIQPKEPLFAALQRFNLELAQSWEYTHPPLDEQFESEGIRQVELDVFADPNGGLFANRQGLRLIHQDPASGIPELNQPGFKVLHVQDLDFESNCWTFVECLTTVKAWSRRTPEARPNHDSR